MSLYDEFAAAYDAYRNIPLHGSRFEHMRKYHAVQQAWHRLTAADKEAAIEKYTLERIQQII